jgi:uncharacterized protein (TIGR03437 family)
LRGAQPQLAVYPSSLSLFTTTRTPAFNAAEIVVDSGYNPIPFQVQTTTAGGGSWLAANTLQTALPSGFTLGALTTFPSPANNVQVSVDPTNLAIGIYYGSIVISSFAQSLTIPVTLNVLLQTEPPPPIGPPVIGSIVNAASAALTGVSPGEIITIYGSALGPDAPIGIALDTNGNVRTTLGGTQVFFGSVPAPLIYVSGSQINAAVPYEVASTPVTTVQVQYTPGGMSTPISMPVVPAVPGIFTISGSGQGAAAVLNEDDSVNSPSDPAARGSVIQIYATGAGQTSPAATTGSIAQSAATSVLPVQASIGGVNAQVLYAGSAPGDVNGVLQVNAVVPQQVTPGAAVPVMLTVGTSSSPARATISVQ